MHPVTYVTIRDMVVSGGQAAYAILPDKIPGANSADFHCGAGSFAIAILATTIYAPDFTLERPEP
jgi:hypothetical protein